MPYPENTGVHKGEQHYTGKLKSIVSNNSAHSDNLPSHFEKVFLCPHTDNPPKTLLVKGFIPQKNYWHIVGIGRAKPI
jgi:hypothetical protein